MLITKNRKGIAELLAYVLLIGLAITVSILVYNWLRFYVIPSSAKQCPDGVSMVIKEYNCDPVNKTINITLKNKGLFRIDGFLIKINNETDYSGKPQGLPVYLLDSVTVIDGLYPGDEISNSWDYSQYERVVEVEVEPFRIEDGKEIYCDKAVVRQIIRSVDCL